MHIAFWSPAWPLQKYQNGIVTYVHWMKRELESQGHRVSVFTGTLDEDGKADSIHYVRGATGSIFRRTLNRYFRRAEMSYRAVFSFGAEIGRAIKKVHDHDPIDVIEMEESFGWFSDVSRITSIPLVVKLHGPAFLSMVEDELDSPLGKERIAREGHALSTLETIVAPSALTLRQTMEKYRLSTKLPLQIVNPIVMDDRTPLWNLNGCDANAILFVGRFDLRKGGDVVIAAFGRAARRNAKLRLIFVGPDSGVVDSRGNTQHFHSYCKLALPPEIQSRVEYRGRMANKEIMNLRTKSMVTVVASRWENQGYALLEAMFQGCPVVSTDAGGCPESVVNHVTGLLARSDDPESFADQMLELIENPARAESLGQSARRHVVEKHAASRVARLSLDVYARAIEACAR